MMRLKISELFLYLSSEESIANKLFMFSNKLFPVLYFIFIKSNNCKEQMEDFASCNKEKDRLCIPVVLNLIIVLLPV